MCKVVIFDWGGVVESHEDNLKDCKDARERLIRRYNNNLSNQDIADGWVNQTSTGIQIETTNDIDDIKDWVNVIQTHLRINVPFIEFKKMYEEEFAKVKYYKEVVDYAHSLKKRCKIAILSNLIAFDKKRIDDECHLDQFDYVYLSFKIGLLKPDKRIYEYVLKDLNVLPSDILFIDDNHQNILVAKECGWNTCEAFGYELSKIKNCVEKFLASN